MAEFEVGALNVEFSDIVEPTLIGSRLAYYSAEVAGGNTFTWVSTELIRDCIGVPWGDFEFGYTQTKPVSITTEAISFYGGDTTGGEKVPVLVLPPNIVIQ